MNEQINNQNKVNQKDEPTVNSSLSLSKLEEFSGLLNVSTSQAIARCLDWAKAAVTLAQYLEIDDTIPENLISRVKEIKEISGSNRNGKQSSQANLLTNISAEQQELLLSTISNLSASHRTLVEMLSSNRDSAIPRSTEAQNTLRNNGRDKTIIQLYPSRQRLITTLS